MPLKVLAHKTYRHQFAPEIHEYEMHISDIIYSEWFIHLEIQNLGRKYDILHNLPMSSTNGIVCD